MDLVFILSVLEDAEIKEVDLGRSLILAGEESAVFAVQCECKVPYVAPNDHPCMIKGWVVQLIADATVLWQRISIANLVVVQMLTELSTRYIPQPYKNDLLVGFDINAQCRERK